MAEITTGFADTCTRSTCPEPYTHVLDSRSQLGLRAYCEPHADEWLRTGKMSLHSLRTQDTESEGWDE